MTNSYPKLQGQGLIETLIVVLFISASVLAVISFQHYASINTSISQQQSVATIVGMNQIEALRNFSVLNTTAGYNAYQDINSGSVNTTVANTTYALTWTVTNNISPTYKVIDLTVSYTDRNGTGRTVRLVTNIAGIDPATSAHFF